MTARATAGTGTGRPRVPESVLQLVLLAGPMLSMIDSSVVNVAVPVIVTDLHTTLATAAWALSGYLLGLACGLAASPWLARRFGTVPAYQAALAGFVLASAACAVVPSVGLLIAARVVQGLLGAPMVPLAMGLLLGKDGAARTMPPSAGIMLFAAPALGPALGGLLIGAFGWRSVFLINVPVGLAALAGLRRCRRARGGPGGDPAARLDLPGLVLLSAGLGLATYGASQGPGHGWLSAASAPAWLGGLALIGGYLLWYRGWPGRARGASPAVNLSVLGAPRRALTLGLACVASVVLFSVLFLAPVYLQDIQHRTAGRHRAGPAAARRGHGPGQLAGQRADRTRPGPPGDHRGQRGGRAGPAGRGHPEHAAARPGDPGLGQRHPLLRARRGARADRPAAGHGAGRGSARS